VTRRPRGCIVISPRSYARFIGEPLNAALNSVCDMPNNSHASVRPSFVPNASRAANGDGMGSDRSNFTFHGHTTWDAWRYTHLEIPLGTGARTLRENRA
jgi:hypothetical protein